MEWISVEERLPEENGDYLISNGWAGCAIRVTMAMYDKAARDFNNTGIPFKQVTHWMPLPDPPKGG